MLEELDKRTQKEGGEEESEEQLSEFEQILSTIKDPQQRELFKRSLEAWKKEQGIITKKDQETEREQQAIVQLATEATRRGVETFGEDFGTLDGSTFKPNPAYVEKARPVLQRLTEQGALTHEDLYWLAYGPDLVQKAREEGRAAALSESNGKKSEQVRRAKKASVVNRPSGGSSDSPLYNREDPKQVGDIRGFLKRAQAQLSKVGTKMSV